jgi:hypothetical protein
MKIKGFLPRLTAYAHSIFFPSTQNVPNPLQSIVFETCNSEVSESGLWGQVLTGCCPNVPQGDNIPIQEVWLLVHNWGRRWGRCFILYITHRFFASWLGFMGVMQRMKPVGITILYAKRAAHGEKLSGAGGYVKNKDLTPVAPCLKQISQFKGRPCGLIIPFFW